MSALDIEKMGYEWYKNYIDENAEYHGGMNANVSDIYSPKLSGWVEVKDLTHGARFGQFVPSTASLYPEAIEVMKNKATEENAKSFVQNWYKNKNVTAFLIYKNNEFKLYQFEDFLKNFSFQWQKPYIKRSGTSHLPKKDFEYINTIIPTAYWDNNTKHAYVTNDNLIGEYFYHENGINSYFISKNKEIRKRSPEKETLTWHVYSK